MLLCVRVLLQEEERERRADFVPDVSAINTEAIEVRGAAGHSASRVSAGVRALLQQGANIVGVSLVTVRGGGRT